MGLLQMLTGSLSDPWIVIPLLCSLLFYHLVLKKRNHLPPGPRGLPLVGYLPFLGANPYKKLSELSNKYGPIFSVRLGSIDTVILNGWDEVKETLSKDAFLGRPRIILFEAFEGPLSFGQLSGSDWREQKRFALQVLRNLGFGTTQMEDHVINEVHYLLKELSKWEGKTVQIRDLLMPSISNIIYALVSGKRLDKADPKRQMIDETLGQNANSFIGILSFFPGLAKFLGRMNLCGFSNLKNQVKMFNEIIKGEVAEHKATFNKNQIRDYIDAYLLEMEKRKRTDPNTIFTDEILMGNIGMFFGAGADTIKTTLEWYLMLMVLHPEVQSKVHEELDNVIGRDREPSYSDRVRMPFFEAVICEVQRFASVVPINLPRMAMSNTIIGKTIIPRGTQIIVNFWAVDHDPKIWKDPHVFIPNRFLSEDGKTLIKPEAFTPFSFGKRSCPGESLASLELFMYSTMILQKFTVEGTEVPLSMEGQLGITLQPKHAPQLRFVRRY